MSDDKSAINIKRYIERVTGGKYKATLESLASQEGFHDPRYEKAQEGVRKLEQNQRPFVDELISLEAIILPDERPAIDIIDDSYSIPPHPWTHFDQASVRNRVQAAIPSIGRINIPELTQYPYAGTGFVVGDDLLMTNRHVARFFTRGLGLTLLDLSSSANVNFKHEINNEGSRRFEVADVVLIHPYWDMALLRVSGLSEQHSSLTLSATPVEDFADNDVAVVGYPAFDDRNDLVEQNRIFRGEYNVKRMQPGKVWERRLHKSYGKMVNAITHDSSTLGGNSGSAVVSAEGEGHVLGLHFAGVYLEANFAVPSSDLARDSRVVDAGVTFSEPATPTNEWDFAWNDVERVRNRKIYTVSSAVDGSDGRNLHRPKKGLATDAIGQVHSDGEAVTVCIPLSETPIHITISKGSTASAISQQLAASTEDSGGAVEPTLGPIKPDPDYSNRTGYESDFLGGGYNVALPGLTADQFADVAFNKDADDDRHLLHFEHFTVCMKRSRSQAYFSACMIDGSSIKDVGNPSSRWFEDKRIDSTEQYMNDVYASNPLDRGHLTRRLSPVWGSTVEEAKKSHDDTFHWPNSAPQHLSLNRGGAWRAIENHILNHAGNANSKLVVFTGSVFDEASDPVVNLNNGAGPVIQIPMQFWKMVAFINRNGELSSAAFLVKQNDLILNWLEGLELPRSGKVDPFQVPITEIESLTDLSFSDVVAFDTFGSQENAGSIRRIESVADIVL